jgi:hypothetical protein
MRDALNANIGQDEFRKWRGGGPSPDFPYGCEYATAQVLGMIGEVSSASDAPHPTDPASSVVLDPRRLRALFLSRSALAVLLAISLCIGYYRHSKAATYDLPILALVAASGALGAFLSALNRYTNPVTADPVDRELSLLGNFDLFIYSMIRPLIGMIAAVVVYTMVLAGLLGGQLFAQVDCLNDSKCDGFIGLLYFGLVHPTDYAKCLVWGFLSGFSERLLPDAPGGLPKKSGIS